MDKKTPFQANFMNKFDVKFSEDYHEIIFKNVDNYCIMGNKPYINFLIRVPVVERLLSYHGNRNILE